MFLFSGVLLHMETKALPQFLVGNRSVKIVSNFLKNLPKHGKNYKCKLILKGLNTFMEKPDLSSILPSIFRQTLDSSLAFPTIFYLISNRVSE